jgi:hypothetical protein
MAVDDKIRTPDYNDIRNQVIGILGTGAGNSGYGQSVRSSAVTDLTRVSVNEWGNLYYDILNCYVHQTGAAPASPSSAVEGALVRFSTTTQPYSQYNTFAGVITSSKFSIAGSQSFTTSKGSGSQTWPGAYGSYWVSRIQSLVTVGFTTADKARGFFNSGCEIRFTSSRSGGTASPTNTANVGWQQNQSWTNFLATVAPRFGGNFPNTGIDPNDGSNFYRLSNAFVTPFYNVSASSPYGSNSFKVWARTPDIADNSSGGATTIQFLVEWVDAYTDPVPGGGLPASSFPPGDGVDGTVTLSCSTLEATGVLQPVGTGNFTVESPTVSIGTITT